MPESCFGLAGLPVVPRLGLVWPGPVMPALPWPGPATTTAAAKPPPAAEGGRLLLLDQAGMLLLEQAGMLLLDQAGMVLLWYLIWYLVPDASFCTDLASKLTFLMSEGIIPEQNFAPDPLGCVPGSKTPIKVMKRQSAGRICVRCVPECVRMAHISPISHN